MPPNDDEHQLSLQANAAQLIDVDSPAEAAFLAQLQGNILKGHGRDHVRLLFLKFKPDADAASLKAKLRQYVDLGHVQSALEQRAFEVRFNTFGTPGPLFSNVLLSSSGLTKLDVDLSLFDESAASTSDDSAGITFTAGAKDETVVELLQDPPVDTWDMPFRDDIDLLILLADDDNAIAAAVLNHAISLFAPVADIVHVQVGDALRNAHDDAIEHFGYIDGRSQPLFYQQDLQREINTLDAEDPALPNAGTYLNFDPSAPKELVLVQDPLVPNDPNSFGSYFVFRKLEQDVRGFKQQERALANKLGLEGDARELAGAYIVGRFEDGTPVVMRDEDGLRNPIPNNFNYAGDPLGQKCPFASHLRKMNPRGDTVRAFSPPGQEAEVLAAERGRRIARRGITYGARNLAAEDEDPTNLPTRDVGLLFMCFQSKISQQFGFLQRSWANNETFLKPGIGMDPIIGQMRDANQAVNIQCPLSWGQEGSIRFGFSGFVTMKGGEFFYAPSLTYLKGL